jgi:hypothetical protein
MAPIPGPGRGFSMVAAGERLSSLARGRAGRDAVAQVSALGGCDPVAILIERLDDMAARLRESDDWSPPDPAEVAEVMRWLDRKAATAGPFQKDAR